LEKDAELTADLVEILLAQLGNVHAIDEYFAFIWKKESVQVLQEHGFAAPACAHDSGNFSGGKLDIHAVEHYLAMKALV